MDEAIERFEAAARDYCTRIEAHGACTCGELLHALLSVLPHVLASGHLLPNVGGGVESDSISIEHAEWQRMYASLGALLGGLNEYVAADPYAWEDREPLVGSLADDLSDIWRDLKGGLLGRDRGHPIEAVVWEWRFALQSHWGRHAADAIRVLQHLHSQYSLDGYPESAESIVAGMTR